MFPSFFPCFPRFSNFFNFDLKSSCALPPYYSLELSQISSTSHSKLSGDPGSRHLNDLLRQQSENAYLKSKNQWILRFWRVFLGFLIFSILDDVAMLWLSISTPWLDFLPGAAPKSIWAGILSQFKFSCSYVCSCCNFVCWKSQCLRFPWSSRFACANLY